MLIESSNSTSTKDYFDFYFIQVELLAQLLEHDYRILRYEEGTL